MLFVLRYLRGFLRIRVRGYSPQRFMNLCSSHGILLWDIIPSENGYEMTVSIKDYYRLKPLLHKTRTKVQILKKTGFPFAVRKWQKRKVFLAGFFLCTALLLYLSTFIWAIEAEGNEQLTREMLLDFLSSKQITYGVKKSKIDMDALEKSLRNEFPFVTWTSGRMEGTRLVVAVKENDIKTGHDTLPEDCADLVADEDGIVESIITRQGVPLVRKGDEVTAGDILISGDVQIVGDDSTVTGHQFVRADGDVLIQSSRVYQDSLPVSHEVKEYTGVVRHIYSFTAFRRTFQIFRKPAKGMYSYVSDHKQLHLFEDFYLPFYFEKKEYAEYVLTKRNYTEKEAYAILNKNLMGFCNDLEEKGVQILQKDVKMRKDQKQYDVQGSLTILKKADRYQKVRLMDHPLLGE